MASVNSTTFIKKPPLMTSKQESALYTKEILAGRIFLGYYQARTYVSALKEYRDLIVISSEETELHDDLEKVRKKWIGVSGIKWVGITGKSKAYCFWVKLSNLPFGHYWFQIKHVKLVEGEILLQLKPIRKSRSPEFDGTSNLDQCSNDKNELPETSTTGEYTWDFDPKNTFSAVNKTCNIAIRTVRPLLTFKNLCAVLRVIYVVTVAIILGTISFIGNLGEYVLKLMRELTLLVNAFSPIVVQLIDLFTKIIGGFYILIAAMFGRNALRPYQGIIEKNNPRSIPYSFTVAGDVQNSSVDWRQRNRILRKELFSNTGPS